MFQILVSLRQNWTKKADTYSLCLNNFQNSSMNNEIIIYQSQDGQVKVDVRFENDTVWLSADQMAVLFGRDKSTISRHIKNIFEEGELQKEVVVANFAITTPHGAMKEKRI